MSPTTRKYLLDEMVNLELRNEADVQRFFVPTLLKLLDYRASDVRNEESLAILSGAHGRRRLLLSRFSVKWRTGVLR